MENGFFIFNGRSAFISGVFLDEVDDLPRIAEGEARYRVCGAVVHGDAFCVRVDEGGAGEEDIGHVAGAFIGRLRGG
jgi:hypothetical protein